MSDAMHDVRQDRELADQRRHQCAKCRHQASPDQDPAAKQPSMSRFEELEISTTTGWG